MSYIGTTEIGKMFLGDVEIDKAYLGSTLVFSGETSGGGELSDYVQSGLVLHMDGKTGKTGTSSWESVVGNVVFTNNGATFNADHIYFDGVDDCLTNTSFSGPTSGSGTIEVVYDSELYGSSSTLIFASKTNNGLSFGINASKYIIFTIGSTTRVRPISTLSKASTSVSTARQLQNGVQMSTTSNSNWTGRDSTNHIGRRSSGNYFKGKIYSIRIYSRQLSSDEVLKNLAVDNIRFELGLTL